MAFLVGALLVPLVWAVLYATQVQQRTVAVAQTWNNAMPVVEAGVEEAFAHLNKDCLKEDEQNWDTNGWTYTGSNTFSLPRRTFADGSFYEVRIITNAASLKAPEIVSIGGVRSRIGVKSESATGTWEVDRGTNTFITRQVRVNTLQQGWPDFGILGRSSMNLRGTAQSFDSSGPSSYWGSYNPDLAEANVLIGLLYGDIDLGSNMKLYGSIMTSEEGEYTLGNGASVGDEDWVNSGQTGVQDGHSSNNLDVPLDPVELPEGADSWPLLSLCSFNCTRTYEREYLTNGAWITTAEHPTTIPPYLWPPGGLVITNTNDIWFSSTYYSTDPGPPVQTYYQTNNIVGIDNVPGGAIIISTNIVNERWHTNTATSATSPAQSPASGQYLTATIGDVPSGYSYVESSGIYVFLQATNYTMANCNPFPTSHNFYYGSLTNNGRVDRSGTGCGGNSWKTNYSYALNWRKLYQTAGGTNYAYYMPTNYMYVTTTYEYYGPRTNDLEVTYTYKYIAEGGNHRMDSLQMSGQERMLITGGANEIYITGEVNLSGQSQIVIAPGSSVKFYLGGDAKFTGNGIANEDDKAYSLQIFGLSTCENIEFNGNARLTGVTYAPDAAITFNGGGSRGLYIGTIIGDSIEVHGNHGLRFVYDAAIKDYFVMKFRRVGWAEELVGALP